MESSIRDVLSDLEPRRLEILQLERDFLELIKRYDVRGRKKNYSQTLSDKLAKKLVADLAPSFPGLLAGETRAGGHAGPVKVDVRLHTPAADRPDRPGARPSSLRAALCRDL